MPHGLSDSLVACQEALLDLKTPYLPCLGPMNRVHMVDHRLLDHLADLPVDLHLVDLHYLDLRLVDHLLHLDHLVGHHSLHPDRPMDHRFHLLDLLVDWVLLPLVGSVLPLLVGLAVVGVVLPLRFLRHFLLAVVG